MAARWPGRPYSDGDNLPVFVTDPALRARLLGDEEQR